MKNVNFFDRLRLIFSAKSHQEDANKDCKVMYSRGEELWSIANSKLSEISDDFNGFEKRKEFKKFIAPLSAIDQDSLFCYLKLKVKQIEEDFVEITSVIHEQLERERLQEFNGYISVLNGCA